MRVNHIFIQQRQILYFPVIAMQPKTSKQFGWFGLMMIATVSGLIIKVVGDPLVQILTPKLEDIADDVEDWLDDQNWQEQWDEWLNGREKKA